MPRHLTQEEIGALVRGPAGSGEPVVSRRRKKRPLDVGGCDVTRPARPRFARLDTQARPEGKASLEMILDLDLRVRAELGRGELMIRDLLQLGPGSVIELDKGVSEPVDVLVNDRLLARGEVVVIDDSFGVRISEIVTPVERVESLSVQEVEQS